jgi:hypothetical protein
VLDIVVHQNIRVSDVVVSDILDSDHLPILFHILIHVKIRYLSGQIEKFTAWERFQSLAYELKKKLRGFSPQANYTDRATAACRRS